MTRFSIIVPVYNVGKYLDACIASILAQSCSDFELILVDDGSTDNSGLLCDEIKKNHADRKITVIHQTHQGPLAARQCGISAAIGEFCLHLDSDDYWEYDLLETVDELIGELNCDLVVFNFRYVSAQGEFIRQQGPLFPDGTIFTRSDKDDLIRKFLDGSFCAIWLTATHNSLFTEFDLSKYGKLLYGEDRLRLLQGLFNAKRIVYSSRILYNYRYNPTSFTHSRHPNILLDVLGDKILVCETILAWLRERRYDTEENLTVYYRQTITFLLATLWREYVNQRSSKEMFRLVGRINQSPLFQEARKYYRVSNFGWQVNILYMLTICRMPSLIYFCAWIESIRRKHIGMGY